MKKFNELTELEIKSLTDEEAYTYIKLKKAEEGVKFLDCPENPVYHVIPLPDLTVYSCDFFGDKLAVGSLEQLMSLVELLKDCDRFKIDYDYNKTNSDYKYASIELDKSYSGEWHTPIVKSVYSKELYESLVEKIQENKKLKDAYEKTYNEYKKHLDDSRWIENEIWDIVSDIRNKYYELTRHCIRFKNEYLPLSENDESVAMNFLNKAYTLSNEDKDYILLNYKEIK